MTFEKKNTNLQGFLCVCIQQTLLLTSAGKFTKMHCNAKCETVIWVIVSQIYSE